MILEAREAARIDRALLAPGLSRSRLRALILFGALTDEAGAAVTDPALKVKPGARFTLAVPPPEPAGPEPEPIPLDVVHEDEALIVVDKPAGMVVHPAPGASRGTLVAALLHHCAGSLSGVGGVARPGVVHRIDKDTSGLIVAAKSDRAHAGLAAQFAAHSVERRYLAICRGAPDRADPRLAGLPGVGFEADGTLVIDRPLGRHPVDRKRMAVREGGKRAVTRARIVERLHGAALLECRLETGRTHQIRVHLAHLGHPLLGDPLYARRAEAPAAARGFARQALHAETLGFVHPIGGGRLSFRRPPPEDMAALLARLRGAGASA